MAGALDGVRILDLSWGIAGPLGVLMLAEQGADVIKVEPPGGDPFRHYSGAHVWNRSRRSVTVDLKTDAGRAAFIALADTADVVVESFRPGVINRLGVGHETLRATNPRVIVCSIPAYPPGHRWADRPGYDALVQASSGQQWAQPGWRMGPIFLHMPMPSMGTTFLVPMGITAALIAREKTGRGQQVTTSLFQGALLYTTQIWQWLEDVDSSFHSMMAKSYPPGVHQQMIYECANGEWVHTSVLSGLAPKKSMDEILGLEGMPDPFAAMSASNEERQKIADMRRDAFRSRDRAELVAELQENNYAVEAIITAEESFDHPQIIANGMRATVQDPELGETTQMGVPIKLLGTPGAIVGPQPTVGQHNDEIWGGLGYSPTDAAAFSGAATSGGK